MCLLYYSDFVHLCDEFVCNITTKVVSVPSFSKLFFFYNTQLNCMQLYCMNGQKSASKILFLLYDSKSTNIYSRKLQR